MENTNIEKDFAIVHNDDTSPHKSKSFSLSPPLRNIDQSIQESQPIKSTAQTTGSRGVDDGAYESKANQVKNLLSHHHRHHSKSTTGIKSGTTSTVSKEKKDTATSTATAFEYPIDYSKKENSSKSSGLRKIVSMKSPGANEETTLKQGTVLNLSKETSGEYNSSPNLPSLFLRSNSPSPATVNNSSIMCGKSINGSTSPLPPLNFGQRFSPLMNQTVPGANMMIPLSYENLSPTLFSGHSFSASPNPVPTLVPSLQLPVLPQITPKSKATRPFKAYPKDPLSFPPLGLYGLPSSAVGTGSANSTKSEVGVTQQANQAYTDFRKRMLATSHIGRCKRAAIDNCGNNSSTYSLPSPSMSLSSSNGTDEISSDDGNLDMRDKRQVDKGNSQLKDDAYWERRRKNNLAAKRSRDARRAKEDEIAIRAAFLEQENLKLRFEVCALKNETAKLRCMLYS